MKRFNKIAACVMSVTMVCGLITVTNPAQKVDAYAKKTYKVTSVSVTNLPAKTLTLKKGKSKTLKVSVKAVSKKYKKFTVSSSKKGIVSAKKKGTKVVVKAKKKGSSKITIKSKSNKKKKVVIKVTVGKPVKKITISKKKATVSAGGTIKLSAKADKKASNKKIVWKSSNNKIAKVNGKGKVTGVAPGKAKIKAIAADGSGKSKTCEVTVKNGIVSAQMINSNIVEVKLGSPQKLAKGNFTVKNKNYDSGEFARTIKVKNITTSDNKTYYLKLASYISYYTMVRIIVSGVSGNKVKDFRYSNKDLKKEKDYYIRARVGLSVEEEFSITNLGYGYCSLEKVSGLPAGIKYKLSDDGEELEFEGTPTKAGNYKTVVTVKDELKNTLTYNVYFIIGSNNQIAAKVPEVYDDIASGSTCYVEIDDIYVSGGSGEYAYSLYANPYGFTLENSEIRGKVSKAGTYRLTLRVTDMTNAAITVAVPVTIHIYQAYTVKGYITDASGKAINNAEIEFENVNKNTKIGGYRYSYSVENGYYVTDMPSGTYKVYVWFSGVTFYKGTVKVTANRNNLNYKCDICRLTVKTNNASYPASSFDYWYDQDNNEVGIGDCIYLLPGTYTLRSSFKDGIFRRVEATLKVTVNNSQTVTAVVKETSLPVAGKLSTGVSYNIPINGTTKIYEFTPTISGNYAIYSMGDIDTYGYLYDASGTLLESDDDGNDDGNFMIEYNLSAGIKYYIGIRKYNGSSTSYSNVELRVDYLEALYPDWAE